MAMVVADLEAEIKNIVQTMRAQTDMAASDDMYAKMLAQAIYNFILTAEVQPNIPVSTTGSATAQTGMTTGPGKLL